jgi:anti-sigma B factor antagonist
MMKRVAFPKGDGCASSGSSAVVSDPARMAGVYAGSGGGPSTNEVAMDAGLPFRVELMVPSLGHAVVALQGELDLFTAPRFQEVLLESIEHGARRVVVDLSAVTFVDSTALGVLIGAGKRLRAAEGSLDIVCPSGSIRRLLELTSLDCIIDIYATRKEALSATPSS